MVVWLPWTHVKTNPTRPLFLNKNLEGFMFLRAQPLIVFVLFLAGSTVTWAGVTQSASFTLSVTIPERAQTPQPAAFSNPDVSQPRMDMQSEVRGQSLVLVISYVVD